MPSAKFFVLFQRKRERKREKVTQDPLEEGFEHIGDALLLIVGQGAVL